MTEKREDMICEICGHPMTYEEQIRVFTCGPFDYHAKALMYQCSCCGYEKLGTCMVQFWENDTPPENICEMQETTQPVSDAENQTETTCVEESLEVDDVKVNKNGIWHKIKELFHYLFEETQEEIVFRVKVVEDEEAKYEENISNHDSIISSESIIERKKEEEDHSEKMETSESKVLESETQPNEEEHKNLGEKTEIGNQREKLKSEPQPPQGEQQTNSRPDMYEIINGKRCVSDAWIDYMLEHSIWYPWWYRHFVSNERKTDRYLKSHIPACQIIRNDVLYDTQTAKMYLAVEKTTEKGKRKIYNYVTPAKKYFSLTVMMGRPDDLMIMEEKDVKKLLAEYPDIYREVIDSDIIE